MKPNDSSAPTPSAPQSPVTAASPTSTAAVYSAAASQLIGEPGHKSYASGTLTLYADRIAFVVADGTEMFNLEYTSLSTVRFSRWGTVYVETPDGKSRPLVMTAKARAQSSQTTMLTIGGTVALILLLESLQNSFVPPQVRYSWYFGPVIILVGLVLFAAMYAKYGLPVAGRARQLRAAIRQYVKVT